MKCKKQKWKLAIFTSLGMSVYKLCTHSMVVSIDIHWITMSVGIQCYHRPNSSPICGERFLDAVLLLNDFSEKFQSVHRPERPIVFWVCFVCGWRKNNRPLMWKAAFRHISAILYYLLRFVMGVLFSLSFPSDFLFAK